MRHPSAIGCLSTCALQLERHALAFFACASVKAVIWDPVRQNVGMPAETREGARTMETCWHHCTSTWSWAQIWSSPQRPLPSCLLCCRRHSLRSCRSIPKCCTAVAHLSELTIRMTLLPRDALKCQVICCQVHSASLGRASNGLHDMGKNGRDQQDLCALPRKERGEHYLGHAAANGTAFSRIRHCAVGSI